MQALQADLHSQRRELDGIKQDIARANLDPGPLSAALNEADAKLEESLAQAPDTEGELECVADQFAEFSRAARDWRAWFDPAKAGLDLCRSSYKDKAVLEERNQKLQVSCRI